MPRDDELRILLMSKNLKIFLGIILLFCFQQSFAFETVFYALRNKDPDSTGKNQKIEQIVAKNYRAINILISQAYQIDKKGNVTGYLDPKIIDFANQHHMKLMVLVTNRLFDTDETNLFLANESAQTRAIQSILELCQQNHYYGVQMDFEMLPLKDRDELTRFYQNVADVLHQHGFVVSFAVAPVVTDDMNYSYYLKRLYERWEGVYNLKELGKSADFLTVMSYNQHGEGTTPGPVASVGWSEKTIQYALKSVPAKKISLGVPAYSNFWYTGTTSDKPNGKISTHQNEIGYNQVNDLIKKNHAQVFWSTKDKVHYTMFDHLWLNEYIFIEDADSFKFKKKLADKYHLRGISVFQLSTEDPRIWNLFKVKSKVEDKSKVKSKNKVKGKGKGKK